MPQTVLSSFLDTSCFGNLDIELLPGRERRRPGLAKATGWLITVHRLATNMENPFGSWADHNIQLLKNRNSNDSTP